MNACSKGHAFTPENTSRTPTGRRRCNTCADERRAARAPKGPDRIPRRSNGWYRDPETGAKLRSVTTIIGQGVPKEALVFWAGNYVAETALNNLPKLTRARGLAARTEVYDWLRRAPIRKKDERADLGSAVHRLIEAHVLGEPLPKDLLEDPELGPYLAHFQRFVGEFQVTFEASEMVVANPDEGYAGTLDYILRSKPAIVEINRLRRQGEFPTLTRDLDPDMPVMGDSKTGGDLDVKGVYAECGMQMAAYRAAPVCWLRDGTKVPMPQTAPIGVALHLRPEGYRLIPIECGPVVYADFANARRMAEWTTDRSKTVVHPPLAPPAPSPATEVA